MAESNDSEPQTLRKGWTTGACATAAAKSAYHALLTSKFLDPVTITLPRGQTPAFALCLEECGEGWARAGIVKDAGDDPDVTHLATIVSTVRRLKKGQGVVFKAGDGVGTVTRPGLPIGVGEPAINPVPRQMMQQAIAEVAVAHGGSGDVEIEVSVPDGAEIAKKTWNPRLGIVGGLSILGTTGIVNPFSCSAWIASIHRGIDVARATGLRHVGGATGSTSEAAMARLHGLPEAAQIDMGDFVGGMLKYLRDHPVGRVTVAGGFAKMTKMAQGAMDLHSGRSQVDFSWLAERAREAGAQGLVANAIGAANTAMQVLEIARNNDVDLAGVVAARALGAGCRILRDAPVELDIVVVDRAGKVIGRAG